MKENKTTKKGKNSDSMALKDLRKKAGLTQTQVAEKLNVGQATVSEWENGVSQIKLSYLSSLASLYDCKISELINACDRLQNFVKKNK